MLGLFLALVILTGTCPSGGCPFPGPCNLSGHSIACWDANADSPGLHYEVCASQDGAIDLGCHVLPRIEYERVNPDTGGLVMFLLVPRYIAPTKWFVAAPHSMVTFTVRTVNNAGPDAWVLVDIIEWPEIEEFP